MGKKIIIGLLLGLLALPLLADDVELQELPSRAPSALAPSDLVWAKKSPYGSGDDFNFPLSDLSLALLSDVDYSVETPDAGEVLIYDGSGWVPGLLSATALGDGDFGDWTCASSICTLDADVVAAAEMADADFGDWSCSSGVCTLDVDVVAPAEIADADFGDWTCASGVCTLDDDVVAADEMADADFGDWTCATGVCALDADVVAAAEMADADFGDWTCASGVCSLDAAYLLDTTDTFIGTLTVVGTVAATTVTGANVTSGADPGHTHTGGSASTDIISEGDSNVEVIDAGTGQVDVDIDGARHWQFLAGSFAAENANGAALLDEAASSTNPTILPNRAAPDDGLGKSGGDCPAMIEAGTFVADFCAGQVTIGPATGSGTAFLIADNGPLKLQEDSTNGTNTLSIVPPTALSADRTCMLADDPRMIPASCVEDNFTGASISHTKCINLDPASAVTDWLFFRAEAAITVTGIDCLVDAATSVSMTLNECDADGGTCGATEAAITCATTNTTEATGIDDAAVDAGDWMRVAVGTVTGSPTQVELCATYTVN